MPNWLSKTDKITFSGDSREIREKKAIKQFKETLEFLPEECLEIFKQWFRQRNPQTRPTFFDQRIHNLILKEIKLRVNVTPL